MKQLTVIIGLLFLTIQLKAQTKNYFIVDSITKEAIPYATISIFANSTGTYSDSKGTFDIAIKDSLVKIYCLGYETKSFNLKKLLNDTLLLYPVTYDLNEIIVREPEKTKKTEIGFYHSKHGIGRSLMPGGEMVVYIPNNTGDTPYIEDILIGIETRIHKAINWREGFVGVYKVNIYAVNPESVVPSSSILKKDLIFTTANLQEKNIIDVSEYNIEFPVDGVFIGIEWIGKQNTATGDLVTKYKRSLDPWISCSYKPKNTIVYEKRSYKKGEWVLITDEHELIKIGSARKVFTPRISLTVYE